MERHREDLRLRNKTLNNDEQSRMAARPRKGNGFNDFGSDFGTVNKVNKKPSTSSQPLALRRDDDSLISEYNVISDSDDELDLLKDRPQRSPKEPKPKLVQSQSFSGDRPQDANNQVSYVVDGQRYEPHPDYLLDGKKKLAGLKFTKKKDVIDGALSPATALSTTPAPSVPASRKPDVRSATENRAGPSRDNGLHKPYRVPTRISKPEHSVPEEQKPARKIRMKPPMPHFSSADEKEQTPRPAVKTAPKEQLVKKDLLSSMDAATSPYITGRRLAKEDMKGKGKAREVTDWPMKHSSTQRASSSLHIKDTLCPIDQLAPLKESRNARSNARPFPMASQPAMRDNPNGSDTAGERKKQTFISPPSSQTSKHSTQPRKEPPTRSLEAFPNLSPLSSPAKPPPTSQESRSSQGSQGSREKRKQDARTSKSRNPRRVYSLEDDDSEEELEPASPRIRARPFPMATQMFEDISHSPVKRGSSDTELSDATTERKNKRVRGADEMCVRVSYGHSPWMLIECDAVYASSCTQMICRMKMTIIVGTTYFICSVDTNCMLLNSLQQSQLRPCKALSLV